MKLSGTDQLVLTNNKRANKRISFCYSFLEPSEAFNIKVFSIELEPGF